MQDALTMAFLEGLAGDLREVERARRPEPDTLTFIPTTRLIGLLLAAASLIMAG